MFSFRKAYLPQTPLLLGASSVLYRTANIMP